MIYGPPAAGKLTVAAALADATGYRLLDNHLTADLALHLFQYGTKPFRTLVESLRLQLFRAAAAEQVDVVSTFVYVEDDRDFVSARIATVEDHGAEVCLVRLCPPPDVLEQRVTGESRGARRKLRDLEALRGYLARYDCYKHIAGTKLSIDNTNLTADDVVIQIRTSLGI
jgi:shikimate kinase